MRIVLLRAGQTPFDVNPVNLSDWNNVNWPGWDGPYLSKVKSINPWNGWYSIQSWDLSAAMGDGNTAREMWLDIEDICNSLSPTGGNTDCPMPENSARRLDEIIDGGDTNGNGLMDEGKILRGYGQTSGDVSWIMAENIVLY